MSMPDVGPTFSSESFKQGATQDAFPSVTQQDAVRESRNPFDQLDVTGMYISGAGRPPSSPPPPEASETTDPFAPQPPTATSPQQQPPLMATQTGNQVQQPFGAVAPTVPPPSVPPPSVPPPPVPPPAAPQMALQPPVVSSVQSVADTTAALAAPTPAVNHDPFATAPPAVAPADNGTAVVASTTANNDPFGLGIVASAPPAAASPPVAAATADDPFGIFAAAPSSPVPAPVAALQQPPSSPIAVQQPPSSPIPVQQPPSSPIPLTTAAVPPTANAYNLAPAAAPTAAPTAQENNTDQGDADFWADMGFGPKPSVAPEQTRAQVQTSTSPGDVAPVASVELDENGLPSGGEYYDARVNLPMLGCMFFTPQDLKKSLFLEMNEAVVNALGERPVVGFTISDSAAANTGIGLGHVMLSVNDTPAKNPVEAGRLIRDSPRPLKLKVYVPPNLKVVVKEHQHMVKYDCNSAVAPTTAFEWKPKYVVIGGIIAKPWMMNMYRSKAEYDIAVKETQRGPPGRGLSVKVKQFDLRGAKLLNEHSEPSSVRYPQKASAWRYIVILPRKGNPILISAPSLGEMKPVHEGIRRYFKMEEEERHRPYGYDNRASRHRDRYEDDDSY